MRDAGQDGACGTVAGRGRRVAAAGCQAGHSQRRQGRPAEPPPPPPPPPPPMHTRAGRKSCAITCATRLSQFLGDDRIRDKVGGRAGAGVGVNAAPVDVHLGGTTRADERTRAACACPAPAAAPAAGPTRAPPTARHCSPCPPPARPSPSPSPPRAWSATTSSPATRPASPPASARSRWPSSGERADPGGGLGLRSAPALRGGAAAAGGTAAPACRTAFLDSHARLPARRSTEPSVARTYLRKWCGDIGQGERQGRVGLGGAAAAAAAAAGAHAGRACALKSRQGNPAASAACSTTAPALVPCLTPAPPPPPAHRTAVGPDEVPDVRQIVDWDYYR